MILINTKVVSVRKYRGHCFLNLLIFVYFALNSINLQPRGSSTPSWVWRQGVQVAGGRESLAMLLLTT